MYNICICIKYIYIYIFIYMVYIYIYIIKTKKDRCVTGRHLDNKCCSPNNKHAYLRKQAQLFTNLYGMNNINDLYSRKRKDYRK